MGELTISDEKDPNKQSTFTLTEFNSTQQLAEKDKDDLEPYDPFIHRNVDKPNSTTGSLVHLLKSSLGTGILAMPMAFKNAGLVFGAIGTIVVGIICTHCVHILVRTSHRICHKSKTPSLGFAETAEKVFEYGPQKLRKFSNAARQFCDIGLMCTYYGASCVYVVFIARSFHDVINYELGIDWDVRIYICFAIIPMLFLGQIRHLKLLVPFSAVANAFIVVTFGITLYYIFNEPLSFENRTNMASWSTIPYFFSTVIFAMEGIGVVMPVENAMKNPRRFLGCPGVLNTAMVTVVTLYAIIGFFGYLKYGAESEGSVTLNLPEGVVLAQVAQILMALAILFTFGLQFYVPMDILWRKLETRISKPKHNISQITIRTGIMLIIGALAAAVPDLEPFIGLVGAVFFSVLGLLVPAVVETVFCWPNDLGAYKWKLWKNAIIFAFSILALVSGATVSIQDIIKLYSGESKH